MDFMKKIMDLEYIYMYRNNDTFLSIPYIEIKKNKKTLLYLLNNNRLIEEKMRLKNMKNLSLLSGFYEYSENNEIQKIKNSLNLFEKEIVFFNKNNLDLLEDEIPFFEQFNSLWRNNFEANKNSIYEKIYTKYGYQLKVELFASFHEFIQNFKNYKKELLVNSSSSKLKEIIDSLQNRRDIHSIELVSKYLSNVAENEQKMLEIVIELFKKNNEIFNKYKQEMENISEDELIFMTNKIEYNFLQQNQRNISYNALQNKLYIKNQKESIIIIKNLIKKRQKGILEYFRYLICNYYKKYKNLMNRISDFNSQLFVQQHIYKLAFVNYECYKLIKKNYKKMLSLNEKDVKEMLEQLEFERRLFISNYLNKLDLSSINNAALEIKKIVKEEFIFSLDYYIARSKFNYEYQLKLLNKYKEKSKNKYIYKETYQTKNAINNEIHKYNDYFQKYESNEIWKKRKYKTSFRLNKKIHEHDFLQTFNQIISIHKAEIKKLKILSSLIENNALNYNKSLLHPIRNLLNKISKYIVFINENITFSERAKLLYASLDEYRLFVKNIKFIDTLNVVFEINEKISIKSKDLVKPYHLLPQINKVKLYIASKTISKPKLLVVIDDLEIFENDNTDVRQEIWRIVDNICQLNNSTQLVISKDKNLFNHFDYAYVCVDDKLIEFGKTSILKTEPIHPWLKQHFLGNNDLNLLTYTKDPEYLYSNMYYISEDHYLFSPNKWLKEWLEISNLDKHNIDLTIDITETEEIKSSVEIENLTMTQEQSIFDTLTRDEEILIADLSEEFKTMEIDQSQFQTITKEYVLGLENEEESAFNNTTPTSFDDVL